MKSLKLFAATLVAVLFASAASAQTVVYISGAPAFRSVGTTAIIHALGGTVSGNTVTGVTVSYVGSSLLSANQVNFYGGSVTHGTTYPVIVKVSYTGSTSGIIAVSSQVNVPFLPTGTGVGVGGGQTDPTVAGNPSDSHIPDFTLSDEFQSTTPFVGTNNTITGVPVTYQDIKGDDKGGILPYEFVSNADAPATLNNITSEQAQQLWIAGNIPLSILTGSQSDVNTLVFPIGRDIGSGLRTVLLATTGIGVTTTITEYEPTTSASIKQINVTNGGSGYGTTPPTVKIAVSGGSGYTSAPTVSFTGGGGTGATATAEISSDGAVIAVVIPDNGHGSGYSTTPTVVFTGGGGSGATATAVIGGDGTISEVDLANPGSGASATANLTGGSVSSITLVTSGSGFVTAPSISFTPNGGGSGAAATAVLNTGVVTGQNLFPAEVVNGVSLVQGDGGYSSFNGLLAVLAANTGGGSGPVGGYYVTALASPDAYTAISAGAHPLAYKGVYLTSTTTGTVGVPGVGGSVAESGYGTASHQIATGQYDYWSYIHLHYLTSHLNSTSTPAQYWTEQSIFTSLLTQDSPVLLGDVHVNRSHDAGLLLEK